MESSERAPVGGVDVDIHDEAQIERLFGILDAYARGPGEQNAPLGPDAREQLEPLLRAHPMSFVLFGRLGGEIVGAAACVWTLGTFSGRPGLNLHDFSVLPEAQGRGVGSALLEEMQRRAKARDASKLTLEVVGTNEAAQRLYERFGFVRDDSSTFFTTQRL